MRTSVLALLLVAAPAAGQTEPAPGAEERDTTIVVTGHAGAALLTP